MACATSHCFHPGCILGCAERIHLIELGAKALLALDVFKKIEQAYFQIRVASIGGMRLNRTALEGWIKE